ncbi:MAG: alanine racemase [Oscillospiraceae bacterium]|nr:alanine racemase [Oscillospiraceae bacterium]
MERMMKRTWAEISLGNLEHNVRNMQAQLPEGCRYLGVVKANAYGHGAVPVAKRLEEIGVTNMAVACYDEAVQLREAGITAQLLILGPSPAFLAKDIAVLGDVCQAVGSLSLAQAMSAEMDGSGLTLPIHLKLDTGMSRTGFSVMQHGALEAAAQAMALPGLDAQGVFTHFAVSDELGNDFTAEQFLRFTRSVSWLEETSGKKFALRHCTNSGAMVNYPEMYLDMVRPGIAQYGLYPASEHGALDLKPVMKLMTRVAEITDHLPGDTVSYGRTYTCERPHRFAVLPIGYADGLHRALSNQLEVVIGGEKARQCGRICMDMCMVDITDLPGVQIGDPVEIFGGEQSVDALAELAGTISYELLCAVSPRVPRVYVD